MAYPLGNWLKIRTWERKRSKSVAWLIEMINAQHYLEKYSPEGSKNIHCHYCGSENVKKLIQFSIPVKINFGFISNSEVGFADYESYRCVSCKTELYRDTKSTGNQNHLIFEKSLKEFSISLLIREFLYRMCIVFSGKFLSVVSPNALLALPRVADLPLDKILNFSSPIFSGVENTIRLNQLLDEAKTLVGPGFYQGDNFFAWFRNNSPLEDAHFFAIFGENVTNQFEKALLWRFYIQICAAFHCMHLNGDFVECGVSLGTEIKNVVSYFGKEHFPKTFWGYDDFNNKAVDHGVTTLEIDRKNLVLQKLKDYLQIKIVSGPLKQFLKAMSTTPIAYLHLNLENATTEMEVLDYLFESIVPNGVIILNSYEWSGSHREHKKFADQWFATRNYKVFPLPTGQGLVLKR